MRTKPTAAKPAPKIPTITDLGGSVVDLLRYVDPEDETWSATNPSIGYHPKTGFVVAIRSSNYVILPDGTYHVLDGDKFKSHVWFSELDKDFNCKNLRKIDVSTSQLSISRGLEDPKLFWRDDAWHFTCVIMEEKHTESARMGIARLNSKCTKITSLEKFPGIHADLPEKNWMLPHDANPNFDFIYGPNTIVKDGILTTPMIDARGLDKLRGNTNLWDMGDGTYLAVCHRTYFKSKKMWDPLTFGHKNVNLRNYHHYFVQYNSQGLVKAISQPFNFLGQGVEFAAGLVVKDKTVYVSFGQNDVSAHISKISLGKVLKLLKEVQTGHSKSSLTDGGNS